MAGSMWELLSERLAIQVEEPFLEYPFENGRLIPTTTDLEPGRTSIPGAVLQGIGEAILLSPGASDIPLVQIAVSPDRYPVVMAASAYDVEFQAERAFRYANIDAIIDAAKLGFARQAIAERLNRFAAYGEPVLNISGFFNHPSVSLVNSSFNPNTATFEQWVSFLVGSILSAAAVVGTATASVLITDVVLPSSFFVRSQSVTDPNDSKISALQAVRSRLIDQDMGGSIRFTQTPLGNSELLERYGVMAAGTNKDRIVIYSLSPNTLSRQIEQAIAEVAPPEYVQLRGLTRLFPVFSCATATKIHNPARIRYIDVVKATAL